MRNTPLKKLETWSHDVREFDYIYIVPTKQKRDGTHYNMWYYLWRVSGETKIIQQYDCWNNINLETNKWTLLQWDFECPFWRWWIKVWKMDRSKIKYNYGWVIY